MANFFSEIVSPLNYACKIHQWNFSKANKTKILTLDKFLISKLEWEELEEIYATVVPVRNCDVENGLFLSEEEVNEQGSIRLPVWKCGIGENPSLYINLLDKILEGLEWNKLWNSGKSSKGKPCKSIQIYQNPDSFKNVGGILITASKVKF